MIEFNWQCKFLKDKFYMVDKVSEYLDKIKDDEKVNICFMDENELKSTKQRKAVHSLMFELWKSGATSFDSYENLRDHFKSSCGLISYDKNFLNNEMQQIQLKVYKMLPTQNLKDQHKRTILQGQKIVRSYSDATKEEASLMLTEVINYCYKVELNTKKFQDIMIGLDR